jgi:hypothetical protein
VHEGHLARQPQRPASDTSDESLVDPQPANSPVFSQSVSISSTTDCAELLSIAIEAEQASPPFSPLKTPIDAAPTQRHSDTLIDDFAVDTTEYDLYGELGFESFNGDSALDTTLFSELAPEILPTQNAPTTAYAHRSEFEQNPLKSPRLSPLVSPKDSNDPSFDLLEINRKLLEQHQRLKKVDGPCTSFTDRTERSQQSTPEIEVGEVLKICQEFSSLLYQVLRSEPSANACHLACHQDNLSPLPTPSPSSGCFSVGCTPRPEKSAHISDPVIILHMSTCYIYLIRNLIIVISQFFKEPKSAETMPTYLTRNPFSGLQIGGFALKNDNLQVIVLIQVVLHSLQEIELPLGVPADYRVCGEMKGRNTNILEDLCDTSSFSDLFGAALRQEERSFDEYGGGGARKLKELLKSVRKDFGLAALCK